MKSATLKQGSHSDWESWRNGKAFSSQGKVRELNKNTGKVSPEKWEACEM